MYLYKKLSSNIDIYTLTPVSNKVTDYKKSAMGEIAPEKQFVTVEKPDLTLVQSRDCKRVHAPNRKILASYYRTTDQFGTTYKIKEGRNKYLYLLQPPEESKVFMNIPEDLYDLENLFQYGLGYIDELSPDDLDIMLGLFDLKGPIATLDTETIEKVSSYGLVPKIGDEIDYKIDVSNEVFKLIRKR